MIGSIVKSLYERFIIHRRFKIKCNQCGINVTLSKGLYVAGWKNLSIGNDVHLGMEMLIMCTRAPVVIHDHVMFGPRVTLITGNHRTDIAGKYMTEIKDDDKRPEDDQPIIFEGDNWIGANSTILKGVIVRKGAIIASGSVVTKDVPEYSCVGGIPARVISYRFSDLELAKHKEIIKAREQRSENGGSL